MLSGDTAVVRDLRVVTGAKAKMAVRKPAEPPAAMLMTVGVPVCAGHTHHDRQAADFHPASDERQACQHCRDT